jgi:hypothetical protein
LQPFISFANELREADAAGEQPGGGKYGDGAYEYVTYILPTLEAEDDEKMAEVLKKSLLNNTFDKNLDINDIKKIWEWVFAKNPQSLAWLDEYADVPANYREGRYANADNPEYHGIIKKSDLEAWEKAQN